MPKLKEVVYEVGGLVALPNYENFRVYYGERVVIEEGDDPKKVREAVIARVQKRVSNEIEDTKREAERAAKRAKK